MVDVKRVTASIKKPILFKDRTTNLSSTSIKIDPTNNPSPSPPEDTVYTIDPFSIFRQLNPSADLEVVIPFTRFYKIKYAVTPNQLNYTAPSAGLGNNGVDAFTLGKPILSFNVPIEITRISESTVSSLTENFYTQDGSSYMTFDPTINSSSHPTEPYKVTGYVQKRTFSPGLIEGTVELYAGDILKFKYSVNVFKFVTQYQTRTFISGSSPGTLSWVQEFPIKMFYWDGVWACGCSFFFEISELTDL